MSEESALVSWFKERRGKTLKLNDRGINIVISALEKQINGGWVKCSERMPECEEEVWIQTKRGTRTTAMYEDGKMSVDNSKWNWNDIDFDYDEETDAYFIPKGWWEYKHFAPDDIYNYAVDEEVIAWKPLPTPYQESEVL